MLFLYFKICWGQKSSVFHCPLANQNRHLLTVYFVELKQFDLAWLLDIPYVVQIMSWMFEKGLGQKRKNSIGI